MKVHNVGIIMNGVTGRMGTNQHLVRSILAIREEGGLKISADEIIMPEPVLVGRNENKLRALAGTHNVEKFSTDLDSCLSDSSNQIYFDAQVTGLRVPSVRKAIQAKKVIYCEKPSADNFDDAMALYKEAKAAGLKNGVVQDKLFLPGLLKLKYLIESGFFGRIFAVRGEFGYWVFDGRTIPCQRPSWNYRKEDSGGIIVDMYSHWRYVIDNLFGNVTGVSCLGTTHIPTRIDEQGKEYKCTAEDAAFGTFECDSGVICHFNSSWNVRVRRDDLLTIHVDGTEGSAIAGLRNCWIQHSSFTPKPVWNPDIENPINFFDGWKVLPNNQKYDNAFKIQWELFLKHVVKDEPFKWTLLEGAKGLQLAELGLKSWAERKWQDVPVLDE